MSAFSTAVATATQPAAIVTLRPDDFAADGPHRPAQAVAVGLSLLVERDIMTCRAEAAKKASELHPEGAVRDPAWVQAYDDELMAWALSLALRQPNDAREAYFPGGQDEDTVSSNLTPQAIRHLWDELERATIAYSPVRAEATDDDLERLAGLLGEGAAQQLTRAQQVRFRKLCSFLLDELFGVELELEDEDG